MIEFNKVTIKNVKPLFNFHIIFDKLGEAIVYTIINMIVEYWQVRVRKKDIPKTAFITI